MRNFLLQREWELRPLIFAHQSIYKSLIQMLGKKLKSLNISSDFTEKCDFIMKKLLPDTLDTKKIKNSGAQVFPLFDFTKNSEHIFEKLLFTFSYTKSLCSCRILLFIWPHSYQNFQNP